MTRNMTGADSPFDERTRRLTNPGSMEGTSRVNTEKPAASRVAGNATSPRRKVPCPDQLLTDTCSLVPGRTSVPGPTWTIDGRTGARNGLYESETGRCHRRRERMAPRHFDHFRGIKRSARCHKEVFPATLPLRKDVVYERGEL